MLHKCQTNGGKQEYVSMSRLSSLLLITIPTLLTGCDSDSAITMEQMQFLSSCKSVCNKSDNQEAPCNFYCNCALDELKKKVSASGQTLSWYFAKFNISSLKSEEDNKIMQRIIRTCRMKTSEHLLNDRPEK